MRFDGEYLSDIRRPGSDLDEKHRKLQSTNFRLEKARRCPYEAKPTSPQPSPP